MRRAAIIFEPGDMIAHKRYLWVAIRATKETASLVDGKTWKHTNLDTTNQFSDAEVEELINSGEWEYIANHAEKFPDTSVVTDYTRNW